MEKAFVEPVTEPQFRRVLELFRDSYKPSVFDCQTIGRLAGLAFLQEYRNLLAPKSVETTQRTGFVTNFYELSEGIRTFMLPVQEVYKKTQDKGFLRFLENVKENYLYTQGRSSQEYSLPKLFGLSFAGFRDTGRTLRNLASEQEFSNPIELRESLKQNYLRDLSELR